MSNEQVSVIARIRSKRGKANVVKKELIALLAPTRSEAGCINYDLHQADDDEHLFLFCENWATKSDLDKHLETPHMKAFLAKADKILAEPVDITLWRRTR